MTQSEDDVWLDKMLDVLKMGTVLAFHPRDTDERYWAISKVCSLWIYPGEALIEHEGKCYVLRMRDA